MVEITSNIEHEASVSRSIPGFVKVVMLLQTVVISFLSFWLYQEYLNNSYFQAYVNGYLQGDSLTAIILISIGAFSTVAIALYAKLRRTNRALEGLLSKETVGPQWRGPNQGLDARTEQHLIEMIQKTHPIRNFTSTTRDQMPTLKRTSSQPSPEEQGSDK